MSTTEIKRMYANIRLPVEVFKNGSFKMIYDKMKIEMEVSNENTVEWNDILKEKAKEIQAEMKDQLQINESKEDESNENESKEDESNENEFKIYKSDYDSIHKKKRFNTTFKKIKCSNSITKKNYTSLFNSDSLPVDL